MANDAKKSDPHCDPLMALADGEGGAVDRDAEVLKQAGPEAFRTMTQQQKLREACASAMCGPDKTCPDALRQRIESAIDEAESGQGDFEIPHRSGVLATINRWLPAAAAALLLVGALVVLNSNPDATSDGVLAATQVRQFETRHVRCSVGEQTPYQSEAFPSELSQLEGMIADMLASPSGKAALDLSEVGYRYSVAGYCTIPGENAIHIIYTADQPDTVGRRGAISLWINPGQAGPPADAGRVHTAAGADSPHPILTWQEQGATFYLVGDSMADVKAAQPHLRLAGNRS